MLLEGSIGLREVRKFEIVLCVVCVEGENWILKKKKILGQFGIGLNPICDFYILPLKNAFLFYSDKKIVSRSILVV